MELEFGTRAIVALAWARRFGLADAALQPPESGVVPERILLPAEQTEPVRFLRLFGHSVLAGPQWFLEAAAGYTDASLSEEQALLRVARDSGQAPGARGLGEATLYYLDEPMDIVGSDSVVVSHEAKHAAELEQLCPRDDVAEVGLASFDHHFTLLSAEDQTPLAGSGYVLSEGLLADMGTLTQPGLRRHGLGAFISAVAVDDALTQGLIPQWCAPVEHRAAHMTARTLGFHSAGSLTALNLGI